MGGGVHVRAHRLSALVIPYTLGYLVSVDSKLSLFPSPGFARRGSADRELVCRKVGPV